MCLSPSARSSSPPCIWVCVYMYIVSCPSGCPSETAPVATTRAAEPPRDLKNGRDGFVSIIVLLCLWCCVYRRQVREGERERGHGRRREVEVRVQSCAYKVACTRSKFSGLSYKCLDFIITFCARLGRGKTGKGVRGVSATQPEGWPSTRQLKGAPESVVLRVVRSASEYESKISWCVFMPPRGPKVS